MSCLERLTIGFCVVDCPLVLKQEIYFNWLYSYLLSTDQWKGAISGGVAVGHWFSFARYCRILCQCQRQAQKIPGVIVSIKLHNFDANSSRCHTSCYNPVMFFVFHYWESFSTRCVTLHLVCLPFLIQNDRLPDRRHRFPGSRGPAGSASRHPKATIQRMFNCRRQPSHRLFHLIRSLRSKYIIYVVAAQSPAIGVGRRHVRTQPSP